MHLNRADRFFMDDIVDNQKNYIDGSWVGSDAWIRKRFEEYFIKLASIISIPQILNPEANQRLPIVLLGNSCL